jgi:hypothetical protein
MTEQEALAVMIPPGMIRPNKPYRNGVIQILVTSSCNLSCANCTQGSNLRRIPWFMTPDQFDAACRSLKGYFGVVGVFGGDPCISPHFEEYCRILRGHFKQDQCGLWSNNLMGKGAACRTTYSPVLSNLNVHLDRKAYDEMKRDWPESRPFGLEQDSRHSPPWVAMKDLDCLPFPDGTVRENTEENRWELISTCDVNRNWSAGIGVFRGELRAWFCEIAMAQSILHQQNLDYPDTGLDPTQEWEVEEHKGGGLKKWWQLPMTSFAGQVRKHCADCGIPLRGHGELAQASDNRALEQTSKTHEDVYIPKRKGRRVELVTVQAQLGPRLRSVTDYLNNGKR